MPIPPMRDGVPVKYSSMKSCDSPSASKTWAPWYAEIAEIPIFEATFTTPFVTAFR